MKSDGNQSYRGNQGVICNVRRHAGVGLIINSATARAGGSHLNILYSNHEDSKEKDFEKQKKKNG